MAQSKLSSGRWSDPNHGASGDCSVPEFPIWEVLTVVLGMPDSSAEAMQDWDPPQEALPEAVLRQNEERL
jgi:hypothetical protein